MYKWFIVHQWKEKIRSLLWQRNLWMYILFGLFFVNLTVVFFTMGLYTGKLIKFAFPEADPVEKFSGFLLYYFLLDLIIRFLYQNLPAMSVTPYLHLPVKRSSIFNFLLFKTLFSVFNWIPLLVIIPFAFNVIVPSRGVLYALAYVFTITTMILINNFIALYLKQILSKKILGAFVMMVVSGMIVYLNYKGKISFSSWFGYIILNTASRPFLLIVPAVVLWMAFTIVRKVIMQEAYMENIVRDSGREFEVTDRLSFLNRYGNTGDLIKLEIKLIWRNSRPKTYLFFCLFFFLYGIVFYPNPVLMQNQFMLIFLGILITAVFMIQHGQLLVAWDSEHFDFILTKNITVKNYFVAKYRLLIISEIASYILCLPYGLFNRDIIFINFALLIYNMGVSTFFVLFLSVYNSAPVELNKSAFLNYQGIKGSQFVLFIMVILLPMLLYYPFHTSGMDVLGLIFLGVLGITGLIFRNQLIDVVVKRFRHRKYHLATNYRNL